mmetsp:Transcript_15420/g.29862  ORF Transcript_15420/g.29862 Transcript_15420/m.29862 type:complete len:229 (-) Transcript_15420:230-916(-)
MDESSLSMASERTAEEFLDDGELSCDSTSSVRSITTAVNPVSPAQLILTMTLALSERSPLCSGSVATTSSSLAAILLFVITDGLPTHLPPLASLPRADFRLPELHTLPQSDSSLRFGTTVSSLLVSLRSSCGDPPVAGSPRPFSDKSRPAIHSLISLAAFCSNLRISSSAASGFGSSRRATARELHATLRSLSSLSSTSAITATGSAAKDCAQRALSNLLVTTDGRRT